MAVSSRNILPSASFFYIRLPMLLVALIVFGVLGGNTSSITVGYKVAQRGIAAAATNSCTVTWGHISSKPSAVFKAPLGHLEMLPSTLETNDDFDNLELDEQEFEEYRIDRIRTAIHWAQCLGNDWPELDLNWCLADWHDGKLIEGSVKRVGETCWWCDPYGWSMDPELAEAEAYTESCLPMLLCMISAILLLYLHIKVYINPPRPTVQDFKDFGWSFWTRTLNIPHCYGEIWEVVKCCFRW